MRVLFFNEGNLGTHVLGHAQLDAALRSGLADAPDVQARFASLTQMSPRAQMLAGRHLRVLTKAGLDFNRLRWHVIQSMRASRQLEAELAEWPADVVHVYSHAVSFGMVATMRRLPVVLATDTNVREWWAMPAWRPDQPYAPLTIMPSQALERRALRNAALVLARTAWTRRTLEAEEPRARVVEYHPGIDIERYRPAPREPRERSRVLFVGGRFREKGGNDLLDVLHDRLGRDVELDVVTPDEVPQRPGVRVHRLQPSDPALLALQQQADLTCLPTYGDTNPWAILESMACATPVVATDVGGIPDMLEGGRTGVVVPHGDLRALREGLDSLLDDGDRRLQLGARARERCERSYDAKRQFPILIGHLQSVCVRRP
jgi:glycosyltransferase involved in cell wall biosynthesis